MLNDYAAVVGEDVIDQLRQLAEHLDGKTVVHVNSTRSGGGVAEILNKMVPLMQALGIATRWEVIQGDADFHQCTKSFHNALQGSRVEIPPHLFKAYEETNRECIRELGEVLAEADVVFIHDPQPAPLLSYIGSRKGKWIWRCHIDLSRPFRPVWRYLRSFVEGYDASIFSLSDFSRILSHPQYIIPPSIDPLSDKNADLPDEETVAVRKRFGLDPDRPLVVQVSRYDRFKDPIGVIQSVRLAREAMPGIQLVLAGGGADDDPEGRLVLGEVREFVGDDPDVQVLSLPPDAHRVINALQRLATVVMQKSTREGFGLTVTEGMWKSRPVIGGDTGGIRLQVIDNQTGFLVHTPEGAALRLRYLLERPERIREMGARAHGYVLENFLITRQLREYLTVVLALLHGADERLDL